jgi:hypothetical protein
VTPLSKSDELMPQKYDYRITLVGDTYKAEVIRRRTSQGTTVECQRQGFGSREEALAWAFVELKNYLEQRKKAKDAAKAARKRRREFEKEIDKMSLQALASLVHAGVHSRLSYIREYLRLAMEGLWEAYAFELYAKKGHSEKQGIQLANETVGENWTRRFENALSGKLDAIRDVLRETSVERANGLRTEVIKAQHAASNRAKELLHSLRKLPGSKIITICVDNQFNQFDVAEDGRIGHAPTHESLLLRELDEGLERQGMLILRQFIPGSSAEVRAPNGKVISIPWKAIYGVSLDTVNWRGLTAEELERRCTTNPDGSRSTEDFVIYKDADEWLPQRFKST